MAFFSYSIQPEQSVGLDELMQICHKRFLCKTPFLQEIPPLDFMRAPRPEYLTWALAALGASVLEGKERQSLELWWASSSQLLGTLDVDNSLARKTDLIKAVSKSRALYVPSSLRLTKQWILLETIAFLSSDRTVRRRARMIHGCIKTVRSFLLAPSLQHAKAT